MRRRRGERLTLRRGERPNEKTPADLARWHFYADKWHNRPLTCIECGAEKPGDGTHPKGWMKRYTPETRTQARCPKCSEPALFKETT